MIFFEIKLAAELGVNVSELRMASNITTTEFWDRYGVKP